MSEVISKKQKLLLELVIADNAILSKCIGIMKPSYFDAPLDKAVECIKTYFTKYHSCPDVDTVEAETSIALKERDVEDHEREYVLEELEEFCQEQAMAEAILNAVDLVNDGERSSAVELIRQSQLVRLDRSIGVSLFDDPAERIRNTDLVSDRVSCGIGPIDDLGGLVGRGDMFLFFATTGGGKSVLLANISRNMAKMHGYNVLVVSLELDEVMYAKRLDAITTNTPIKQHMDSADEIAAKLAQLKEEGMGDILMKRLPYRSSPNDVRNLITEYHLDRGYYPDVLILDYITLMGGNTNHRGNISTEHEEIAFSLKEILVEFGMYGFSAGQITKDAEGVTELTPAHCAGGKTLVNASDLSLGLVATEEDIDNNQVQMAQLKVRNAGRVSTKHILYRSAETLNMSDKPYTGPTQKQSTPVKTKTPVPSTSKEKKEKEKNQSKEALTSAKGKDKLKAAMKLTGGIK